MVATTFSFVGDPPRMIFCGFWKLTTTTTSSSCCWKKIMTNQYYCHDSTIVVLLLLTAVVDVVPDAVDLSTAASNAKNAK
jgi:hypothetical protein